ncbi:MAG: hypothetical protein AABZ59_08600, partial [Candidatus Binatota bacterium]
FPDLRDVVMRLLKKLILRPVKKVPDARRVRNRRAEAYEGVRWSETVERNEADGPFSTAW